MFCPFSARKIILYLVTYILECSISFFGVTLPQHASHGIKLDDILSTFLEKMKDICVYGFSHLHI